MTNPNNTTAACSGSDELAVATAIVRIRALFEVAPWMATENYVPDCGLVTFADLKAIQEYADAQFEAADVQASAPRSASAGDGVRVGAAHYAEGEAPWSEDEQFEEAQKACDRRLAKYGDGDMCERDGSCSECVDDACDRLARKYAPSRKAAPRTVRIDQGEEDDPSTDDRWQAGCDFAMLQLCVALGVDPKSVIWDAATETLDGDVRSVIGNIMCAKYGDEWSQDDVRIDRDVGIRAALEQIDALISNGDRPTVNEQNAFEHFGKLNRLLLSIRDIARAAISENTTAVREAPESCPHCFDRTDCSNVDICKAVEEVYREPANATAGATSLGISEDTAQLALDVHARRASPKVGPVGSDDDIRFLALSMAGEAGEAANVVKKAWRDGTPLNRPALAEEIAGTACYLIGISAAIKLNLNAEMREQMAQFELRYASNPLEGKAAK